MQIFFFFFIAQKKVQYTGLKTLSEVWRKKKRQYQKMEEKDVFSATLKF